MFVKENVKHSLGPWPVSLSASGPVLVLLNALLFVSALQTLVKSLQYIYIRHKVHRPNYTKQIFTAPHRRKIRLTECNAKCHYLNKMTCKGTLRPVFYLSEAPSPPMSMTPYYTPLTHCIGVYKAVSEPTNRWIETVNRDRESVATLVFWGFILESRNRR